MAPGAHAAYITAHDSKCPEKGKLFEIPITVIRTETLTAGLKPGVVHQVREGHIGGGKHIRGGGAPRVGCRENEGRERRT